MKPTGTRFDCFGRPLERASRADRAEPIGDRQSFVIPRKRSIFQTLKVREVALRTGTAAN